MNQFDKIPDTGTVAIGFSKISTSGSVSLFMHNSYYMVKKILLILIIIGAVCGGVVLYASATPTQFSTYELRLTLKEREQQNPRQYLDASSTLRPNMVRKNIFAKQKVDGYFLKGSIKNTASSARFKDITIEVIFYSKTNSEISRRSYLVYEIIEPGHEKSFSYKIEAPPQGYAEYTIDAISAIPVR